MYTFPNALEKRFLNGETNLPRYRVGKCVTTVTGGGIWRIIHQNSPGVLLRSAREIRVRYYKALISCVHRTEITETLLGTYSLYE